MTTEETLPRVPVLIVGGGIVGLCAALMLRQHGNDALLVERRRRPSALPRSRGVHARTVEIFRSLGIENIVRDTARKALKAGAFGGARIGPTMLTAEPLAITRPLLPTEPLGPSSFCFLPQVDLEPVLIDLCRERGVDLRMATEATDLVPDADGVTVTLAGPTERTVIRADYVIAADGAASPIRSMLGIGGWELPPTHHYINVFFRSDLAELVSGRTFSQCEIRGERVRGLMLCKNNTDEWSLHIEYDPLRETVADYPARRCVEAVRAAVGAGDIDVDILARAAWNTGVHVADEYRSGRVFLVGDAAHRHAPWGGFGANTGVADAHNLVWKLAAALAGHASEPLLDTYRDERRPRAVLAAEQARLRTDMHARFGIETSENAADVAQLVDMDSVLTLFRYGPEPVATLSGQVGTRVPHLWLTPDATVSTLDVCGPRFTVLADTETDAWTRAADRVRTDTGVAITVHNLRDQAETWRAATDFADGGALLVRPDQYVAARSDEGLTPFTLAEAVKQVLR